MAQAPSKFSNYLALMRWHQPVGYWLLLWPCWWSITLASYATNGALPEAKLLALFLLGAIVMRSAGCVINDLWDREIDAKVARTRNRPLASGALSVKQALGLLCLLLSAAAIVVLQLKIEVFWLALASLPLVILYPLMKRITWWPQAFLGLTFNFGALMGWVAVTGQIALPAVMLYISGIFWTLGYDTIYAHQDREDDIQAGVKSTACLLNEHSRIWVGGFYLLAVLGWLSAGYSAQLPSAFYVVLSLPAGHLFWQWRRFDKDNPARCLQLFRSNHITGFCLWLCLLSGFLFYS
jgi:4-hydroxybenzoate polyprenyltransferase